MIGAVLAALLLLSIAIPERDANGLPHLRSESVIVRDVASGAILLEKNADALRPIASVTKLISALVLAKSSTIADRELTVLEEDKDRFKWSRSRLAVGTTCRASELLSLSLSASDNRAMHALVRGEGHERARFAELMTKQARALGMKRSKFVDPAGLHAENVSTARELLLVLEAAAKNSLVCAASTESDVEVEGARRPLRFGNTNRFVRSSAWKVIVSKTGYTVEAGRNLVLRAEVDERLVDMVFLGSREMASVFGDAGRVRRWLKSRTAEAAR